MVLTWTYREKTFSSRCQLLDSPSISWISVDKNVSFIICSWHSLRFPGPSRLLQFPPRSDGWHPLRHLWTAEQGVRSTEALPGGRLRLSPRQLEGQPGQSRYWVGWGLGGTFTVDSSWGQRRGNQRETEKIRFFDLFHNGGNLGGKLWLKYLKRMDLNTLYQMSILKVVCYFFYLTVLYVFGSQMFIFVWYTRL